MRLLFATESNKGDTDSPPPTTHPISKTADTMMVSDIQKKQNRQLLRALQRCCRPIKAKEAARYLVNFLRKTKCKKQWTRILANMREQRNHQAVCCAVKNLYKANPGMEDAPEDGDAVEIRGLDKFLRALENPYSDEIRRQDEAIQAEAIERDTRKNDGETCPRCQQDTVHTTVAHSCEAGGCGGKSMLRVTKTCSNGACGYVDVTM